MPYEPLIRKLRRVEAVRRDLGAFLERLGVAIRAGIASLRRGVPPSEQTAEAAKIHAELVGKLDDMHHAVHEARAEGVRTLVEDEGLPVSTVAHMMGRPRQLVSRLYQQARGSANGSGNGRSGLRAGGGRHGSVRVPRAQERVRGRSERPRPPAGQ